MSSVGVNSVAVRHDLSSPTALHSRSVSKKKTRTKEPEAGPQPTMDSLKPCFLEDYNGNEFPLASATDPIYDDIEAGDDRLEGATLYKGADTALPQSFMDKLMQVARGVCRVRRTVKSPRKPGRGTGSILTLSSDALSGLIMTNHHVLETVEEATGATLEFNYIVDNKPLPSGRAMADPNTFFITSPRGEYDCTIVAFKFNKPPRKKASLSQVNVMPLYYDQEDALKSDERVYLIHHPRGRARRYSIQGGKLNKKKHYLLHSNDTQKASSGAPVLNQRLQRVALHHKSIPARDNNKKYIKWDGSEWKKGDDPEAQKYVANQGVLMNNIIDWLCFKVPDMLNRDVSKLEILLSMLVSDNSPKMRKNRAVVEKAIKEAQKALLKPSPPTDDKDAMDMEEQTADATKAEMPIEVKDGKVTKVKKTKSKAPKSSTPQLEEQGSEPFLSKRKL